MPPPGFQKFSRCCASEWFLRYATWKLYTMASVAVQSTPIAALLFQAPLSLAPALKSTFPARGSL